MSLSYSEKEDLVQKAISDYEDGRFPSAQAAVNFYKINPRRVQRRLKEHHSKKTRKPSHTRLDSAQEQSLCDYIERLNGIEYSIRLHHIRRAAEYILKIDSDLNSSPPPLGKD